MVVLSLLFFFFFQAEDGIRDFCLSRGLGDVYKRQVLDRAYNILEQLPASLLKVRLLTYCYGEIYEEGLLQEAHSIMDKWDKGTLTSEQAEVMEELKNIEENQYPFEILD